MYRTLILNNAVYIALLIILITLTIKIVRAHALKEYNDRLGLFFSSFRFYGKPILRNMISKPKQEYLRFNNKLNAITYIALLGILVLYSVMNAI